MSNRGNMFANVANEFEFSGPDEIIERTTAAFCDLTMALVEAQIDGPQGIKAETLFAVVKAAAKFGLEGTEELSAEEKRAVNAVFEIFDRATGSSTAGAAICEELAGPLEGSEKDIITALAKPGFGMPMLRLILGFAYADGAIGEDTAAELESIFAMCLMADFMQSGMESVPAPKVRVSSLEKDIVEWFRSEDSVYTLDNICAHFPDKSRTEVENALESLREKGILFTSQTFMGKIYALE